MMIEEVKPKTVTRFVYMCRQCGSGNECELIIPINCQGGIMAFYPRQFCPLSSVMDPRAFWERLG